MQSSCFCLLFLNLTLSYRIFKQFREEQYHECHPKELAVFQWNIFSDKSLASVFLYNICQSIRKTKNVSQPPP